jgi:hypothetical protein
MDSNHMNDIFISVFSSLIFYTGSAVGRGTGRGMQCTKSWMWDYYEW